MHHFYLRALDLRWLELITDWLDYGKQVCQLPEICVYFNREQMTCYWKWSFLMTSHVHCLVGQSMGMGWSVHWLVSLSLLFPKRAGNNIFMFLSEFSLPFKSYSSNPCDLNYWKVYLLFYEDIEEDPVKVNICIYSWNGSRMHFKLRLMRKEYILSFFFCIFIFYLNRNEQ